MGLKEIYSVVEEKYYGLMDGIDKTGIPVYKVIDFFESKNIPSFPLFIIFILLLIGGSFFLLTGAGGLLETTTDFPVIVKADGIGLERATITYELKGEKKTVLTNSSGEAIIKVIAGKDFNITAEKTGYAKKTQTFNSKDKTGLIVLTSSLLEPIKVQLLGKGNELLSKEITIGFSCTKNSEWNETITVSTGSTELSDVPVDCGTILAEPIGLECDECNFTADGSLIKIYLDEIQTETGTISFTVEDSLGNLLDGIEVLVIPVGSTIAEDSCSTYNGMCSAEVSFGEYYIRATDYTGKMKDFDSAKTGQNAIINSNNQNVKFNNIILDEGVIGEIKLRVKDSDGKGIENALVKLFKDGTETREQRTNSSGEAIINVAEQINYTITVTHPDYLNSSSKTVSPKTDFYEINLEQATASNKRAINVLVVDEKGEPVENTKLFLKDSDTLNIVGDEKITGFDGKAVFDRVPEGSYIVRAEKKGFEGKDSRKIEVKEKEPQEITIALDIGEGTLDVTVLDKERQPIQSATVKVKDYYSNKDYAVYSTDQEGKKSFTIRADKKVFLEVSESSHSNYISAPIQMFDGTEEKTIVLEDEIQSFQVKLDSLELEGQELEDETVNQGKTYKTVFKVMIPRGTVSNEAGVHIRTGADAKNQNNTMEKDDLYIKSINASNAKIIKGTTFNPSTGEGIDNTHLTSGNAKWANIILNNVREATYEITAIIQVREVVSSADLELAYRGWIIEGGYQRDPFDEELQETESTGTKQALYAKARHEPLKIGASSLCSENFCTSFTAKDLANATRTNIVDSFPAEISSNYELEFNIISLSEKTYSNSELAIEGKGLELNSYEIEGEKKNASDKIIIPIGSISKGQKISGKINFTTKSEGTNRIDFSLFGESLNLGKEKILFKPIRAEVALAKTMNIVTTPKNLVPFIQNNLLVNLTDEEGNALNEATVKIEKDSQTISIGKTDSKGIYAYSFEPLNAGTEIKITAEKAGFNQAEKTINISENIVSFVPAEIKETFNAKKPARRTTRDITLKNITEMPLTIREIELSDSFKGLVNAVIPDYLGTDLLIGSETQILVDLGLTEKGRKITQAVSVSGNIIIVFENLDAEKQWTATLPIEITIGLGGEVDYPDCFSLSPDKWSALTQNKTRTTKLALNNSCTVDGENIALKNVKAKVIWKENEIGDLDLTSTIEGTNTLTLKNTYQILAEEFNPTAGDEENLELTFLPDDIPIGSGTATVYLEAVNPTENGEQLLKQKIEVNVQISELTECLRIIPTNNQLRIQMNYYNQGWGYTNQYFGYDPSNTYSYLMNPNTQTTLNRNYPYSSYPYDPNASPGSVFNNSNVVAAGDWRSQQFPSTYYMGQYMNPTAYNQGLDYQFNFSSPGKGTIEIQNDCPSQVQIELEPAPEIAISDSTIILEAGGNKTIEVTPSMFIGQYSLVVRAKHKTSDDAPTEIRRYNVLVESEFMRNYFDCISLSTRVFTFNDVIPKPVEGTVWNTCYDQGVILSYQSIPSDLSGTTNNNYGYPTAQDTGKQKLESSGIIDSIQIIQLINKPGADGKIVQELKFRLRKNLDYYALQKGPKPSEENPLLKLANMRIRLAQLYYKVEAEEILPVTFYNRTGTQETIPFDITIEDLWEIAGQDIIDFGNPNISHQQCVIGLNYTDNAKTGGTNQSGCFENQVFQQNGILNVDAQKVIKKKGEASGGKDYCGDPDRITEITNNRVELDSGIILLFNEYNGDNIKLTIDKSNATCNPKSVSGTLYARLSRSNPATTKTVSIPYSLCIDLKSLPLCGEKPLASPEKECKDKAEEEKTISERINEILGDSDKSRQTTINEIIDLLKEACSGLTDEELKNIAEKMVNEAESTAITKCADGGETGTKAFEKYCFENIKLDWAWDSINEKECETENTFCDSTQLTIELAKKAAKINELGTIELDQLCNGYCEEDVKNSKNLFRFLVNQTKIKDETSGETLVFFIDNKYSIIAGTKFSEKELSAELQKTGLIAGWLEASLPGNAKTVTDLVDEIIAEMESNPKIDEKSVIGEIDLHNLKELGGGELESMLGADKIETGAYKYFITFNEYKAFRDKLKDCIKANSNATECAIEKVKNKASGGTTTIIVNLEMMKELQQNIEFKAGIRNIKEISEEDKTRVMQQGKLRITTSKLGYDNLLDFYRKNIEFTSYLKKDGFGSGFNSDFYKAYLNEAKGNEGKILEEFSSGTLWKFKTPNNLFETGSHKILFDYDWYSNKKTEVTITLDTAIKDLKGRENCKDNYLFEIPFDGKLGYKDNEREGYGTKYGADSSARQIYLNTETALKNDLTGGITGSTYNAKKSSKFEDTRNGTILEIDNNKKFSFTPSKAIGLTVDLSSSGSKGIFYDLIRGQEGEKKAIGLNEETGLNYLFNWTAGKDSRQKESQLNKNNESCTQERFGIIFEESTKEIQKVLSFVPVEWGYTFKRYCSQGIDSMTGYAFDENGKAVKETLSANGVFTSQDMYGDIASKTSLEKLINDIKTEKVCVTTGSSEFKLEWNKEKLMQEIN